MSLANQKPIGQKTQKTAFLINTTRKKTLAAKGKVLKGLATGIGAMFRGLPGSLVLAWWHEDIISVTNWFVPCDLDILWVNNAGVVVDLHERFAAGSFRTVNKTPARYVVELASGTIAKTKTKIGDRIACRDIVFTRA